MLSLKNWYIENDEHKLSVHTHAYTQLLTWPIEPAETRNSFFSQNTTLHSNHPSSCRPFSIRFYLFVVVFFTPFRFFLLFFFTLLLYLSVCVFGLALCSSFSSLIRLHSPFLRFQWRIKSIEKRFKYAYG